MTVCALTRLNEDCPFSLIMRNACLSFSPYIMFCLACPQISFKAHK